MATTSAALAAIHQHPNLPPLEMMLSTHTVKKISFHSHPPLASYVAVSILHWLVVTAHPPRWSNRPHLPFQMWWACSKNPPLLSTSTRRADGGEEKVRNNLLAWLSLIYYAKNTTRVCWVIASGATPHLLLGLSPRLSPVMQYQSDEGVDAGGEWEFHHMQLFTSIFCYSPFFTLLLVA
jgi:hypothetical protein